MYAVLLGPAGHTLNRWPNPEHYLHTPTSLAHCDTLKGLLEVLLRHMNYRYMGHCSPRLSTAPVLLWIMMKSEGVILPASAPDQGDHAHLSQQQPEGDCVHLAELDSGHLSQKGSSNSCGTA